RRHCCNRVSGNRYQHVLGLQEPLTHASFKKTKARHARALVFWALFLRTSGGLPIVDAGDQNESTNSN
ncbi:MAG: hypothetical protein NTZ55_02885, partial [Candidatus Roizmanbacteria bacterium]|nr:hypothetical protein [Candidatus Roizmanbacteria bacterium]